MSCPAETDTFRRVLAPVRHPLGGIRSFIYYVYPKLLDAGYRFTFVGPAGSALQEFWAVVSNWGSGELYEAPVHGKKWIARGLIRSLLRERRFDLIHSHGLTAGVDSVIANFGIGVPHVLSSHGVITPRDFPGAFGRIRRFVVGTLLSRVDAVVAESNDARENHLEYFPRLRRRGHIRTIFNGIVPPGDYGSEPAENHRLRQDLGLNDGEFLIGFLGRFMPEKGFLVLVEALQELVDRGSLRPFHVVTTGAADFLVNYRRELARRQDVAQRITFMGQVPHIAPVLHQLDLLVMPSLWEACPLLPMEAMATGVPVLGSDCIGLREVLRGTPSMMVPANDPSALTRGILRAMENPWKEEARRYIPIARERFDVCQTAKELRNLFDGLTGSRRRAPARSNVCCKR